MQNFYNMFSGFSFNPASPLHPTSPPGRNGFSYFSDPFSFFPGVNGNSGSNNFPTISKDPLKSFYETLSLASAVKKEIDNPLSFYNRDAVMKSISTEFYKMLEMLIACHSILWVIYGYQCEQKRRFS